MLLGLAQDGQKGSRKPSRTTGQRIARALRPLLGRR
jgi:hypothetical protein